MCTAHHLHSCLFLLIVLAVVTLWTLDIGLETADSGRFKCSSLPPNCSCLEYRTQIIYDPRTFREDLLNLTDTTTNRSHLLVHSKALSVYDAVWTIASAWDSVLSAVDCVNSTDLVTKGLKNALREISKLEFQHLWDEKGCVFDDRMNQSQRYYGQVIITQFQDGYICPVGMVLPHNLSSGGTFVPLSETHSHPCPTVAAVGEWIRNFTDPLAANCKFNFYWRDGGDTPRSGFSVEHSAINIPFFTFVCVATMVLAALIICVAIFNLTHAKNKFIKATSPKISLGITLGLLITLPIPVLVGLIQSAHSYGIDGSTADRLCWSIVWTPIFGIAILYSTLHAKNFRLFRIFYNKKLSTKSVLLSNRVLVMSVLLSLVPPIVSCIVSTAASSITHTESNIPLSEDEFSFHYIRASHCSHTNSALLISLAVYLVLLIIPTVLLAYFTMRIKSRFGVDGKGTLATALTLLCGSWIFYLLQDQFDVQRDPNGYANIYYFLVLDIFAGTFLPLCFLYIPPYYYMYKASKKSEVVQKLESEENSKRVEIYNNLRSQAVELRGQVDKIEIKLNLLRTKRCSVDVETQ